MFYKTLKTSETGKKFDDILKKKDVARKEQIELSEKYKFKTYRSAYFVVWGGFSSCLDFEETPDRKIWGKGAKTGEYMPKKNSKIGKSIDKEFEKMTIVTYKELNSCVGINEPFGHIGFNLSNDEFYLFKVPEKWDFNKPKDCIEITRGEYLALSNTH